MMGGEVIQGSGYEFDMMLEATIPKVEDSMQAQPGPEEPEQVEQPPEAEPDLSPYQEMARKFQADVEERKRKEETERRKRRTTRAVRVPLVVIAVGVGGGKTKAVIGTWPSTSGIQTLDPSCEILVFALSLAARDVILLTQPSACALLSSPGLDPSR